MTTEISRRVFSLSLASGAVLVALPRGALALTDRQARDLVSRVVGEIDRVINSGKSESAMFADFEKIFRRYADVQTIARSVLGPDARSASSVQLTAFADAFTGYLSRKYGRRFREFVGGVVEVHEARQVKSFYEVRTTSKLQGQAPFDVTYLVSDRSGKDLFFDMLIEGISLLKTERTEIGAMLDKRRGDINLLTLDLRRAG